MEFKTSQRKDDLRWIYTIDGKDSETTYPTAGEAERGAMAAMSARPAHEPWKIWLVLAAAVVPVVWFLVQMFRMLTQ